MPGKEKVLLQLGSRGGSLDLVTTIAVLLRRDHGIESTVDTDQLAPDWKDVVLIGTPVLPDVADWKRHSAVRVVVFYAAANEYPESEGRYREAGADAVVFTDSGIADAVEELAQFIWS